MSLLIGWSLLENRRQTLIRFESGALVAGFGGLFLASGLLKLPAPYTSDQNLLILFTSIPLIMAIWMMIFTLFRQQSRLIVGGVLGMVVWTLFMAHFFFPAIDKYKDSATFVKAIKAEKITSYTLVNYNGYSPYLMYYLDRVVKHTDSLDEVRQSLKPSGVYYLIVGKSFNEKIENLEHIADGYHQSLYRITIP
jgi:hypothetical protein